MEARGRGALVEPVRSYDIWIPAREVALPGVLEVSAESTGVVLFAHGSGSSRFSSRNNFVAAQLRERLFGTLLIDLLTEKEDEWYATGLIFRY